MGNCQPIEPIGACGGVKKANNNYGNCGQGGWNAVANAGGPCGGGQGGGMKAVKGGGEPIYRPQGVDIPRGQGGPDWGGVIESYIDPNDPTPPTRIVNGDGQAYGTGPNFDYYLTGDPAQERYDLIYDLNDPAVIDMLGGPERWSDRELTALSHSARHKPAEKQRLFFQAVADMVRSPEPLSLNDFSNLLQERGYEGMSPEYRNTEVTAWWTWAQVGDSYDLPRG